MIVDYIGIFDDVAQALAFDEKAVQQVVTNIDELRRELPAQVRKCLAFFPSVDRTVGGYEGLSAAQLCLPNNETRDGFAAEYTVLGRIWEALSPDACLTPHETDFRWLTQVCESVKPTSGNGRLLWHALGAKTVDLINQNVHVESVRDDLDARTHVIVERIVNDIDDIVRKVRFPDWQHTTQGERLVQKELRKTLLKYQLHRDQELFDKAYGYIRQYY